jgi:hypothetical protein
MSLRGAINRKCKECIYDPVSGTGAWRQQVQNCMSKSCALYEVRPTSKAANKIESEAKKGAK